MEVFMGSIMMFGFNFAPRGWSFCNGSMLGIAQSTALYSLLGTSFGGNGQTTFGLPDLRSRVPIGMGQSAGNSNYTIGQASGSENVTLNTGNLPQHAHQQTAVNAAGTADTASGNVLATASWQNTETGANTPVQVYAPAGSGSAVGMANNTGFVGSSTPFSILQPYQCVNMCIALEGIYPSRQ